MMKWLDFFFAARPLLHLPIWSIYLVSLWYHLQLSGEQFTAYNFLILVCLSLLAAGAYFVNQIHDIESDFLNRKLGFLQRGFLSLRSVMAACVLVSIIPLALAFLFSFFILFIFLQSFVLGHLYSVPPFRLKDRPIGGFLANAYSIGFLLSLTVMPDITVHNAGLLGWDNPFYFFLTVGATYLLTTIPDADGDLAAGKRTVSVVFPIWVVKIMAIVLLIISVWVAYRSEHILLMYVAILSIVPILVSLLKPDQSLERSAAKFPILLLTLVACWFFPCYLIILVVLIILTRLYYRRRFGVVYPKLT